jgi:nucleotide-binding universal stress UspA family protein
MNGASILVATDFSETSHSAVHRAAMIAQEQGARLELVHVVSDGSLERVQRLITSAPEEVNAERTESRRDDVQQLADELIATYRIPVDVRVLHGPIVPMLTEQADVAEAALMVFGARGISALRRWLIGSTPERALRDTTRPVLVVKQPPRTPYRRALVPVDFSLHAQAAVHMARLLAPAADLVLLHVAEVPFEGKLVQGGINEANLRTMREAAAEAAAQAMDDFVHRLNIHEVLVRTMVAHADVSAAIVEHETKYECDLVVMGKRGTSLLDDLLLGSVTRHVLAQSTADVLVAERDLEQPDDR